MASDSNRLENFSDAVFAFSATLLVVSLEVPNSYEQLLTDLAGFGSFAVTFGALVLIWTVHAAYFRRYPAHDGWTVALNACLLFVVLFFVFPLKFLATGFTVHLLGLGDPASAPRLGSYEELGMVFMLYGTGFMLVFTFVALMYHHAARRAALLGLSATQLHEARFLMRHYGVFAVVGLASILVAWMGIGVRFGFPGWLYMLLGPLCWWHGVWSDRHKP